MKINYAKKYPGGAEVTSKSGKILKKYSPLVAKLSDGRTIEEAYQLDVKGYRAEAERRLKAKEVQSWKKWMVGVNKKTLKGQTRDQLFVEYITLYTQWARENPHHLEELRYRAHAEYFSTLTDQFASDPEFSQAKALAILLNDTDLVYNYKIDLSKDKKLKDLIQKRHKESIEWATKLNKYLMKRGNLRVNKIIHFRKKGDKTHPLYPGFLNIDVTQRGSFKELSPMILGPISHNQAGVPPAQKMENLWQYSKVYQREIDSNGNIMQIFYDERIRGFNDIKGHRKKYPGEESKFVYWNNKQMDKVKGRKQIYCKYYADYVVKTAAYRKLEKMLDEGVNIQLVGYDGIYYNPETDSKGKIFKQYLNDPDFTFGHELVLAALLTGHRSWLK